MSVNGVPAGYRRWLAVGASILLAGSLTGCFSAKDPNEHCNDISEYQASRSVPGVVVPEGLAEPSRSSGLVVPPPVSGDAAPPGSVQAGAACLSRPPAFFREEPAPAAN